MAGTLRVLYTHQKYKKAKVWQDGYLKFALHGTKSVLYSDEGINIDTIHVTHSKLIEGYEIETDKHLITIEEVLSSDSLHNLPLTNTKNPSNSRTKGFSTPSQYSSEEASVSKHLRKSHSDINTNSTVCTMTSEPVKVKSKLNTYQLLHPTDKTGHFLSQTGKGNCQKFEFTSSHVPSTGANYYEKTGSVSLALNNKRSVSQILDILKSSDERQVNQEYPVNPLAITTKDSNSETNFSSVSQYSNSPLQQSLVPQNKKMKQSCDSPDDLMLIPAALLHRANPSSSQLPHLPLSSELKFSCVVSRSQNFETNSNSLTLKLPHEYLSPEVQSTHGELIVPSSNDPYVYSDSTEEQVDTISKSRVQGVKGLPHPRNLMKNKKKTHSCSLNVGLVSSDRVEREMTSSSKWEVFLEQECSEKPIHWINDSLGSQRAYNMESCDTKSVLENRVISPITETKSDNECVEQSVDSTSCVSYPNNCTNNSDHDTPINPHRQSVVHKIPGSHDHSNVENVTNVRVLHPFIADPTKFLLPVPTTLCNVKDKQETNSSCSFDVSLYSMDQCSPKFYDSKAHDSEVNMLSLSGQDTHSPSKLIGQVVPFPDLSSPLSWQPNCAIPQKAFQTSDDSCIKELLPRQQVKPNYTCKSLMSCAAKKPNKEMTLSTKTFILSNPCINDISHIVRRPEDFKLGIWDI